MTFSRASYRTITAHSPLKCRRLFLNGGNERPSTSDCGQRRDKSRTGPGRARESGSLVRVVRRELECVSSPRVPPPAKFGGRILYAPSPRRVKNLSRSRIAIYATRSFISSPSASAQINIALFIDQSFSVLRETERRADDDRAPKLKKKLCKRAHLTSMRFARARAPVH